VPGVRYRDSREICALATVFSGTVMTPLYPFIYFFPVNAPASRPGREGAASGWQRFMDAGNEGTAGEKSLPDSREDVLLQRGIKVRECQIPAESEMEAVFGCGLPDILHE